MSTRGPAAALARLKLTFANWKIERRGDLFRAIRNGYIIHWTTAADLEQQLAQESWRSTS